MDLITQLKQGLITQEEFNKKIKEINNNMKKDFNKMGFKSEILEVNKIRGLN